MYLVVFNNCILNIEKLYSKWCEKHISNLQRPYLIEIPKLTTKISKSISPIKPPEILVIHLQRLTYNPYGLLTKNN